MGVNGKETAKTTIAGNQNSIIYNNGDIGSPIDPTHDFVGIGWNRHFARSNDPRYFFGAIDEVVIWDEGLAASKISNHYESGVP